MAITVFVYDDKLVEVPSGTVQFEEQDDSGVILDTKSNLLLTPGTTEYGARLAAPAPACSVVVWVDDTSGFYAPMTIGRMNGGKPVTMHVTLYPLPAPIGPGGGGGSPVIGVLQAQDFIAAKVNAREWTASQGEAVRSLVETVARASLVRDRSDSFMDRFARWTSTLANLGIQLARKAEDENESGQNSSNSPHDDDTPRGGGAALPRIAQVLDEEDEEKVRRELESRLRRKQNRAMEA